MTKHLPAEPGRFDIVAVRRDGASVTVDCWPVVAFLPTIDSLMWPLAIGRTLKATTFVLDQLTGQVIDASPEKDGVPPIDFYEWFARQLFPALAEPLAPYEGPTIAIDRSEVVAADSPEALADIAAWLCNLRELGVN